MSDIAINVENLSKRYRIGLKEEMPDTLVGAMKGWLRSPLANFRQLRRLSHFSENGADPEDVIWALKDVSFEVKQGEVIGIIGRNGAGKSTLLKILSRITEPTSGRAIINGRVSSLLEVGTGFHPELTGRENVYLNGTVLGMTRKEIDRKFDEIVDFSGVEKFIDTSVKRYSSGMQVRLAFAVAAHLEPEIMLVDEVLAVGDIEFQKKCLGKMGEVAKSGRTVLFVSHNMGAITGLCSRAILIADGENVVDGPAATVVAGYVDKFSSELGASYVCDLKPNDRVWIKSVALQSVKGVNNATFLMSEPIRVECVLQIVEKSDYTLSLQIKEMNKSAIFHFPNGDALFDMPSEPGVHRIGVEIPPLNLYPGKYLLRVALTDVNRGIQESLERISFQILQDFDICSRPLPRQAGLIYLVPQWNEISANLIGKEFE
jgi:lipopolysaccharide transport system ATP-binding protein